MYEQSLYKVLKDHIKPKVLLKNIIATRSGNMVIMKEHDVVVISKTGENR